ncbi:MAG: hypothetical protein AAGK22_08535 [Acidobacteriota bacterium]
MSNNTDLRPGLVLALRIAAVLWVVWGLVHILAGGMTLWNDTSAAIAGIADAIDPVSVARDYPAAAGAVVNQHGFNLLWIGVVTLLCAPLVWRGSKSAILLAALVGGLADLGYFLFLDLGGFVRFVPGTVMTIFSSAAIVLSFVALWKRGTATPSS